MRRMLAVVSVAALALAALAVAYPQDPPRDAVADPLGETAFENLPESFANAAACAAHLATLVRNSAPPAFDKAVGPYAIAASDVRAHRVKAKGWGHDIEEYRCLGTELSMRRWSHSMNDVKPFTIEDIGKMSFPAE